MPRLPHLSLDSLTRWRNEYAQRGGATQHGRGHDAMLNGSPAQALDIMASRFSAVETLATTKDWNMAKHLQLVPSERVSCVNEDYMDYARRRHRADFRMDYE